MRPSCPPSVCCDSLPEPRAKSRKVIRSVDGPDTRSGMKSLRAAGLQTFDRGDWEEELWLSRPSAYHRRPILKKSTRCVKQPDVPPLSVDRDDMADPGLLQGICALDEHISPKYPTTSRCRSQTSGQQVFNDCRDDGKWKYHTLHPRQQGKPAPPGAPFGSYR